MFAQVWIKNDVYMVEYTMKVIEGYIEVCKAIQSQKNRRANIQKWLYDFVAGKRTSIPLNNVWDR